MRLAWGNFRGIGAAVVFSLLAATPEPALALTAEPEVLDVNFAAENPLAPSLPTWAERVESIGGTVSSGKWNVDASAPVGFGQVDIVLDSLADVRAVAITLVADRWTEADLAINLYNAFGELIAVDLFGDLFETAVAGRSDTFIVSLTEHPEATRISIRRIQGPVSLRAIIAFPAVEALDDLTREQNQAFAKLLGERLARHVSSPPTATDSTVPIKNPISQNRQPGTRSVLASPDYPERFWNESLSQSEAFAVACGGSCYRFATNLYLSLFPELKSAKQLAFVSSTTALAMVIENGTGFALTSLPPSAQEFADYQRRWGRPLLVVPVATDAVEVLVHPSNALSEIDFAALRRIFAESETSISNWETVAGSQLSGAIQAVGGHPTWGTSRLFAERVLNGNALRSDLIVRDITFASGVEEFVANNPNAIGFAQHRFRTHAVKPLRLAKSGPPAAVDATTLIDGTYPLARQLYMVIAPDASGAIDTGAKRFADLLLSRDGQTAIADAGSFPLSAQAVLGSRRQIGLP